MFKKFLLVIGGFAAVVVILGAIKAAQIHEAMRVPRVKRLDVRIPRLGGGLDGATVVVLADTHYGPIDRAAWSRLRENHTRPPMVPAWYTNGMNADTGRPRARYVSVQMLASAAMRIADTTIACLRIRVR